jgi:exonuclease V gamma subunit
MTPEQELTMLLHELLKSKIEDKLVAFLRQLRDIKEEDELDELSLTTLDRYRDKASSQLRRGTYGSSAYDSLRTKMRKRTNRFRGVKQADNRIEKHDDEKEQVSEGIGDAVGHLARHTAAQALAKGLGLHPSLVHAFVSHLAQRRKEKAIKAPQQQQKPKAQPKPKPAKDPDENLRAFFDAERRRRGRFL